MGGHHYPGRDKHLGSNPGPIAQNTNGVTTMLTSNLFQLKVAETADSKCKFNQA